MSTVITYSELRRNLVPDPRATALTGWNATPGSGGVGVASLLATVTDHPLGIGTAYRYTWTTTSSGTDAGPRVGTNDTTWGIPVTPGRTYAGSVYGKLNRSRAVRAALVWTDGAGNTLATSWGTTVTPAAGNWTRVSLWDVAPVGARYVRLGFYGAVTPWYAGDTADVTAALVEASPGVGAYFDGATLALPGTNLDYAWTGTPNASASIYRQQTSTVTVDPDTSWQARSATTWGVGDFDAPDVRFNGVDAFGVEWICETPDGWSKTTAETPLVEGGGDGGVFAPGRRKPKVLTLRGAFRCADRRQLAAAETRLRAALEYLVEDTTLWHGPTPAGTSARQMTVRLSGELDIPEVPGNPRIRTFSAALTAADPFKYAAGSSGLVTASTRLPQLASVNGMSFPASFPLSFGGADLPDGHISALLPPDSMPVFPVTTFTGPGSNVQLHHAESGSVCGYTGPLVGGQQVTLDHRTRSVLTGGRSVYMNRLPGTTFFTLLPGSNTLAFTADAYDPATLVTVTWRPRYR